MIERHHLAREIAQACPRSTTAVIASTLAVCLLVEVVGAPVGVVARALNIPLATASLWVDDAVASGYVRRRHAKSRRGGAVHVVEITPKGLRWLLSARWNKQGE